MSEAREGPSHPEPSRPAEPSTQEQAWQVLKAIGKLAEVRGYNFGDRNSFSDAVAAVPPSIAEHFPQPEPDSQRVEQSYSLIHMIGRNRGGVGSAAFSQHEHRDDNLTYTTRVSYSVITDDGGSYRLERHVNNTEDGSHMVGQYRGKSSEQLLNEALDLRDRENIARPLEEALGIPTVDSQEAGDIIKFLEKELKEAGKLPPQTAAQKKGELWQRYMGLNKGSDEDKPS